MMEGIDASCDAACFVGYHAMAGTRAAVLDHTFIHSVFRVRVDDAIEAGEFALNAAVAGAFAVPVVFASGDDKAGARGAGDAARHPHDGREGGDSATRRPSGAAVGHRRAPAVDGDGGARAGRAAGAARRTSAPCASSSRAATSPTRPRRVPVSSASTRAQRAHRRAAVSRCLPDAARLPAAGRHSLALRGTGLPVLTLPRAVAGGPGSWCNLERFAERM